MKLAMRLMIGLIGAYVLYRVAMLVVVAIVFTPTRPSTYVDRISTNPATYARIATIPSDQLALYSYEFERNQFVNALSDTRPKPHVADSAGNMPAFKVDGDVFVVTYKGANQSAGLAISDDPGFIAKIETLDDTFRVKHLRGNVFQWDLDLD